MSQFLISDLETSAKILMAPPNMVTSEQRHTAEKVFLAFRTTKSPYEMCRQILETSTVDFLVFEAIELMKLALIREWEFLEESNILSLQQYLMQYVTQRQCPPFNRDKIVRLIAIMIKRSSIVNHSLENNHILTEIEGMIINGDLQKQVIGFNLIINLIQEYATTVKSTDVGLPWNEHYRAKKLFEIMDLKRILKFCIGLLARIDKMDLPFSEDVKVVLKLLLVICESVFTWSFISTIRSRRMIGVFESVHEADHSSALRLFESWSDVILDSQLLPLMFSIYWKVRDLEQHSHHALTCLMQLASVNGQIMYKLETKVKYLQSYMEGFVHFITSVQLSDRESLSVANILRRLVLFYPPSVMKQVPGNVLNTFLENLTLITCTLAKKASNDDYLNDQNFYSDSLDVSLECWASLLLEIEHLPDNLVKQCCVQIFNTYVQCHLCPPDGTREHCESKEINEMEDNDRIKFKDQLQSVGFIGRMIPEHAIMVLNHLLKERIQKLKAQLQQMQNRAMNIDESKNLENIFEDIHWIVLISGHVISMESKGEQALIPKEIMKYSIDQHNSGFSNVDDTLQCLANFQDVVNDQVFAKCDPVVNLICGVLRLCSLETLAIETNLIAFMSPEVGSTLMWFLHKWSLTFLLPEEMFYAEVSRPFNSAFGGDSSGAEFVFGFLIAKIRNNICRFTSEPVLLQDTVTLFLSLVSKQNRASYILKSDELWKLVDLQFKLEPGILPQPVKRNLFKAFVRTALAIEDNNNLPEYWKRTLGPAGERFKTILSCKQMNIYHEEAVKTQTIDVLESFIGVAMGVTPGTADSLYEFLMPHLEKLPALLNIYHNYQIIVQLILEALTECSGHLMSCIKNESSPHFYNCCLALIQTYVNYNSSRLTSDATAEENSFQDLLLLMDLITNLLTKDFVPTLLDETLDSKAVDVGLYGLSFIMPLMTLDLLKYPSLCVAYYKLITCVSDVYPQKVASLPLNLLGTLINSVELGVTNFGSDVAMHCLDFIQVMAAYVHKSESSDSNVYRLLMPSLKLLLDSILSNQINSDLLNAASTALFALICCYGQQYKEYVQAFIAAQENATVAEKLAEEFTQLTANIEMQPQRQGKLKFRDRFDKFIVGVHGFLLVK